MANQPHDNEISELLLAISLLVRRFRSAAPAVARDLSWTQKAVLKRLEREGPASSADLARAEGVKPQSMGAAITALQELGFVERRPHPEDGRQFIVKLTASGATMRKQTSDANQEWLAGQIEKLGKKDQQTLFAASDIIKRLVEL